MGLATLGETAAWAAATCACACEAWPLALIAIDAAKSKTVKMRVRESAISLIPFLVVLISRIGVDDCASRDLRVATAIHERNTPRSFVEDVGEFERPR